jgi:iron(III) transport system permease protein
MVAARTREEKLVTVEALPAPAARPRPLRLDLSGGVMVLFAAGLCLLIVLPMAWLGVFAFTDRARNATLANFHTLFTDPAFVEPLITTLTIATSVSLICCFVAAPLGWIVARTDIPLARTIRILVMASFVTPPFLGAIAWEILAAPNSGLLNQLYRAVTGQGPEAVLFNIYTLPGLVFVISCYTFPYVFVLVANALDRIPGDLEDASSMLGGSAWRTARRVTIPLALPALAAGALVAFLQALTLFGSPAILALPAGFHTMTTKIWSLFQFPPKPELAAAAALPLLLFTIVLLRGQAAVLGRRGYSVVGGKSGPPRLVRLGVLRWPALALCLAVLCLPVFLPYLALANAAFSRIPSQPLTLETFTLYNFNFVFFELSATQLAMQNTFLLGLMAATFGSLLALVIAYLTARAAIAGHRFLGFLATAPIAIPGIVLGVGLFLAYTRGPVVLYGTLWILLLAYLTIELPAAYQQLQSAFKSLAPELEEASRVLGASRLRTLRDITAPLLGPSLVATWCFIFVAVVRELSAAVILFTSQTKVLSVLIFDLKESGDMAAIAVLGLTMLVLTTIVLIAANRIPGFSGVRLRNN